MADPVYIVELKPPRGDDKPHLRLKRALKCLSRSFKLQCLSVREKPAPGTPAAGTPAAEGDPEPATVQDRGS